MSSLPRGSLPEISCSPKTPSSSWALSHTQWSRRSSSRRTDCCAASRLLLQLHGGRQPLPCLRPDCLTCCLLMALFLLVLPSTVGGTKWDAVTQLIAAGLHSRQSLSWPGGSPVSSQVLAKLKHTAGLTWTCECSPPWLPASTSAFYPRGQLRQNDR